MVQITLSRNLPVMFLLRNRVFVSVVGLVVLALGALVAALSFGQPPPPGNHYVISQKNQKFHPDNLIITRGDTVTIVNDDGDLHHHAYVSSPDFSFDSGDQLPGSRTDIVFTVTGQFNVLCGIHPKMHLGVTVMPRPSLNAASTPSPHHASKKSDY